MAGLTNAIDPCANQTNPHVTEVVWPGGVDIKQGHHFDSIGAATQSNLMHLQRQSAM